MIVAAVNSFITMFMLLLMIEAKASIIELRMLLAMVDLDHSRQLLRTGRYDARAKGVWRMTIQISGQVGRR